jgi:hypothetical protein
VGGHPPAAPRRPGRHHCLQHSGRELHYVKN